MCLTNLPESSLLEFILVEPCVCHWVPLPCCSLPSQASLPNKVSCFVKMRVSLDNSFSSVRQEPTIGPWKGCPSLQQIGLLSTGKGGEKQVVVRLCNSDWDLNPWAFNRDHVPPLSLVAQIVRNLPAMWETQV